MRIRSKQKVANWLAQAEPLLMHADGLYAQGSWAQTCLEVGCGRGRFLQEMARLHPDWRFIGCDRYTAITARAAARCAGDSLMNVRFCDGDIRAVKGLQRASIDCIYLNFSDPWPRRRHEARRLTHASFLSFYRNLLVPGGRVEYKTDDAAFFDWRLQSLTTAGWTIAREWRSLPAQAPEGMEGDAAFVRTEYEERFRASGMPILHLRAVAP
jgi:tRNA (guanine-N7-)-methyltransferase